MKHVRSVIAFAVLAFAIAAQAAQAAEPIVLKFAWTAPLGTPSAEIAMGWKDDVVKSASGALQIQVFPDGTIAKSINVLDRVLNGVADIGFGILGPYSRAYPQSFVVQLPFACNNSAECSTDLWRLYARGIIAEEYKTVHPLALFCFTGASLHSTKPFRRLADLAGAKVAASGKVLADDLSLSGAVPITLTPADFFESLQRGTVQGVLISWPGATSFKLQEVSKYHMDTPFGLFPAFVIMNNDSYVRLPDDVKRAFDKNSGELFSKRYGTGLDKSNQETIDEFKKMKGHEVIAFAEAEMKRWAKILEPTIQEWVNTTPNGAHVLSSFRAEMERIRSGS